MLQVYIFDHRAPEARALRQLCRDCIAARDLDADTPPCCTSPQGLLEAARRCPELALFLVELLPESAIGPGVRELRAQNEGHYLILALNRIEELMTLSQPYYRPSGYLLHPVSPAELERLLLQVYGDYRRRENRGGEAFTFQVKAKEFRVPYRQILYFESANKKIIAHTAAQEFLFSGSLEQISQKAPTPFMRVHKSFCANLGEVGQADYARLSLTMSDGSVIFFSRTYKAALREALAGLK